MKYPLVTKCCALALLLSGCVVETRPRSETASSPSPGVPPAPPPPAPAPGAAAPLPTTPAVPETPPPSGAREGMPRAPLPRDLRDPPRMSTPLPPQPPPKAPPKAPPIPVPTLTGVEGGMPTFTVASPPAYYVWRTPEGVWKLRTSDGNTYQKFFMGRAFIQKDRLHQISFTRTELERRVDVKDGFITFDFSTQGSSEGFDFTTEQPNSCIYFELYQEPAPTWKKIYIGSQLVQPSHNHFYLCPQPK